MGAECRGWPRVVAAEWGVIAMKRLEVILALGSLLGMFGGVLTASPVLARERLES
jgi:hypothetical protein